jgi:hypothetical protein
MRPFLTAKNIVGMKCTWQPSAEVARECTLRLLTGAIERKLGSERRAGWASVDIRRAQVRIRPHALALSALRTDITAVLVFGGVLGGRASFLGPTPVVCAAGAAAHVRGSRPATAQRGPRSAKNGGACRHDYVFDVDEPSIRLQLSPSKCGCEGVDIVEHGPTSRRRRRSAVSGACRVDPVILNVRLWW